MSKLSQTAWSALNAPDKIRIRDMWFQRMRDLFAGKANDYDPDNVFRLCGTVPRPANDELEYSNPEAWILECLELCAKDNTQEQKNGCFAPCCVEYPIYGVHYIDRMLGAEVFYKSGQWNAKYLSTPVGQLEMPDLDKDETWALSKRATQAFLDADVKLPLFGLPTLSSPLNILLNLYGQEGLVAMMDDEDAVRHDLEIIAELIRILHRWYLDHVPTAQLQPVISWDRTQPPGCGQVCGCTCQLISGELYKEFIAPLDDRILAEYPDKGMIHLCGSHLQHLKTFHDMPHLHAVQLNDRAAHDLAAYFDGLREDQVIYLNPCEGMTIAQALEITHGRRLVLCHPT